MRRLTGLALVIFLVACNPATPQLTPFAASAPNTQRVLLRVDTPVPTQTARALFPTSTLTQTTIPVILPTATVTPTFDANAPTWTPLPSWTPPPVTEIAQLQSYFLLNWPIANSGAHTLSRAYPYGSTNNGRLQVHHGVDLVNALGTPLFAAADGTVVYAGNDFTTKFGSDTNYYGNLVVIQHNFLSPEQLPVFTLYGHMQDIVVQGGQVVQAGEMVGTVGQSGIARGPHVHFEVRVGNPFDFDATRNPEMWLHPFPGQGVLAGRVTDANGTPLNRVTLSVQSAQLSRSAYSYTDATVNGDPALRENFTLGDLPPDYYVVSVNVNGIERFSQSVYVQPDQMTWLDVVLSG